MSNLTPEQRSARAKKAAAARWGKSTPEPFNPPPSRVQGTRRWGMDETETFCRKVAQSLTLSKEYYEPPAGMPDFLVKGADLMDIATARAVHVVQLGAEIGLPPAQALASITLRYGKPTINGDAQLAVVLGSGQAEYVREYTEGGEMYIDGQINMQHAAVCETLRRGEAQPTYGRFSVEDAHTAELWNKPGSWKTHKPRMMKYKARGFCLRDKYPDILKGLAHNSEEMEGEAITPPPRLPATDISPENGAEKLTGLLAVKGLNNTQPALSNHEKEKT